MTLLRAGESAAAWRWVCRADSDRWGCTNVIGGQHLVVLARLPVLISQEGRDEVLADPGGAMLYAPGQHYTRRLAHPDGDVADVLTFTPEVVDEATGSCGFVRGQAMLSDGGFLAQRLLYRDLAEGGADPLQIDETLLAVLADVTCEPGQRTSRLVDRARTAMAEDLSEPLSLSELGRRVHVSPFHLARTFRGATGSSLHRYREGLKLRAAVDRVLLGQPLADIAADLGFASHSHLTARFRARLGLTPRELRT